VRYVLPMWIVLDGVVELCGTPAEGLNAVAVQAPAPLRVRVAIKDALLDSP
jgi:hypothetical protein